MKRELELKENAQLSCSEWTSNATSWSSAWKTIVELLKNNPQYAQYKIQWKINKNRNH